MALSSKEFIPPAEALKERQKAFKAKQKDLRQLKTKGVPISYSEAEKHVTEEDFLLLAKWIRLLGATHKKMYFPLVLPLAGHWHFEVRAAVANAMGLMRDRRGIWTLLHFLKDSSPVVCWEAKCALIQLGAKEVLKEYHSFLQSDFPGLRLISAQALGDLTDAENTGPLQNAFKGAERSVKVGIIAALAKNNFPAGLNVIEEALIRDNQPEIRATALLHLSKFPKVSYLEIFKSCLQDSALLVRLAAIQGIKNLGYHDGVVCLSDYVADKNPYVRASVARAFGEIGGFDQLKPLLHLLKDSNSRVRVEAATALGRLKYSEAVPALSKATQDLNPSVRSAVAFALYTMDEHGTVNPEILKESVKLHLFNLDSGDIYERREALQHLVIYQDLARAGEIIADTLKDHDMEVRRLAIRALALNESNKIQRLLAKAFSDKEMMVKWELAYNFSDAAHETFDEGFCAFLEDLEPSIRIKAAQYFANKEACLHVKELLKKVTDKEPIVRWYSILALMQSEDTAIVPALKAALSENNLELAFWAAVKLGEMGVEEAINTLLQNLYSKVPEIRMESSRVLALFKPAPSYIARLYHALSDDLLAVRRNISYCLIGCVPSKDLRSLLPHLAEKDPITFHHLSQILLSADQPEVNKALVEILQSPTHPNREVLAQALVCQPSKEKISWFVPLLEDAKPKIRMSAAEALAKLNLKSGLKALMQRLDKEEDSEVLLTLLRSLDQSSLEGLKTVFQTFSTHPQSPNPGLCQGGVEKA